MNVSSLVLSSTSGIVGSIIAGDATPGTTEELINFNRLALAGSNRVFVATTSNAKEGIWAGSSGGSVVVTDVGAVKLPKRFYRVAALP